MEEQSESETSLMIKGCFIFETISVYPATFWKEKIWDY